MLWLPSDVQNNYHHVDTGDFEPIGQKNHANLANLAQELDDLCHRVQAGEDQPAETLHCIEQELQRLTIALCLSAPPEPLDSVLRQYTDTLVFCPKANKFHKHFITGYDYFHWK